jgi:hypothetical protein
MSHFPSTETISIKKRLLVSTGSDRRMTGGGLGPPKVLSGPTLPYLSLPCEWAIRRVGGLQPFSTPLDTPRSTPMLGKLFKMPGPARCKVTLGCEVMKTH